MSHHRDWQSMRVLPPFRGWGGFGSASGNLGLTPPGYDLSPPPGLESDPSAPPGSTGHRLDGAFSRVVD